MKPIRRYLRAFFLALKLTLRGERPPEARCPELSAWTQQTLILMRAVYAAADQQSLNRAERQRLKFILDRRLTSVETILAGVEHHAAREYPSLLGQTGPYNLAAIQAANVNDRYALSRLKSLDALQTPDVQMALSRLSAHLEAIPTITPD